MKQLNDRGLEVLLARLRSRRLIFTVTTGRSGTAYLAAVFGYFREVAAFHEPAPEYVEVLREAQQDRTVAATFLRERKLRAIAHSDAPIYVETSHLACKGFLESYLEMDIVPDLVIHRRPMREISLSLLKMGTIPGRTDKGVKFYLSPDDPDVLPLPGWQKLTDYQICYWYCLEIERRAQHYRSIFRSRGARVVETTLAGLKTLEGLDALMRGLDLRLKFPAPIQRLRFRRNSRFKVNESTITKKQTEVPADIDRLEAEVEDLTR